MALQHVEDSTLSDSSANRSLTSRSRSRPSGPAWRPWFWVPWAWSSATSAPARSTRLKECLHAAGGRETRALRDLFGILSLMFWALIMVVTVKYLMFVMRADHHGEGGIFALLAIVPERFRTSPSGVAGSPAWRSWP